MAKLEGLIGNLGSLNQQLAEEAKGLSSALRGSAKAQGDWGEFILRDLLEKAGLREGEQYSFQQSFTGLESEDGGKATIGAHRRDYSSARRTQSGDRLQGFSHGVHRLCKCGR